MKKSLIAALTASVLVGTAGMALANPFDDVPSNHWAYDSIAKLAKEGIITGYADRTFRGDQTLNRYEMAQVVGEAIAKSDKADAAQKAEIDKLAKEYADELQSLGVRVSKIEKTMNKVKLYGDMRYRYEWADSEVKGVRDADTESRFRVYVEAPLSDKWSVIGRLNGENSDSGGAANIIVDRSYVKGTLGGMDVQLGKQLLSLGLDSWVASASRFEGLKLTAGNDLKVSLMEAKRATKFNKWHGGGDYRSTFHIGDLNYKKDDIHLNGFYMQDRADYYKTYGLGAKYTGVKNLAITGQYAQNDSDYANRINGGDAAKGHYERIKYRGVDRMKPGSWGVWLGYRSAERGFDPVNLTNFWGDEGIDNVGTNLDAMKGYEIGFEYTVGPRTVVNAIYTDGKFQGINHDEDFKQLGVNISYYF